MNAPLLIRRITPAGKSAVAVLELSGEPVWTSVRDCFAPAGNKPLPELPAAGFLAFGRVREVGDEVVLLVRQTEPEVVAELQCHGGEQVVAAIAESLQTAAHGNATYREEIDSNDVFSTLAQCATLQTARLVLAQINGAWRNRIAELICKCRAGKTSALADGLNRLVNLLPVTKHLKEPFRICLVGAPNVGKSSLMNALSGFQRSVVTEIPGTTRDVVTTRTALGGWPCELADTAGIRGTDDPLEREGIARAQEAIRGADQILWVLDSTASPVGPTLRMVQSLDFDRGKLLFVLNKCDLRPTWDTREVPHAVPVSAASGAGMSRLFDSMIQQLIPQQPKTGEAFPFRSNHEELLLRASHRAQSGDWHGVEGILQELAE